MKILKLNRMNDALFKGIFANAANINITLSLVNSVINYQGTKPLTDLSLIDRELSPMEEDGKESRLDLLGQSADGEKVNLEIQVMKQGYYGQRSLYYWARLYNSLKRGDEYADLKRTILINILDFNLFDEHKYPHCHSCFGVYDLKTGNQLTKDLEIHFIELPKWQLTDVNKLSDMERWVSYFDKKTTINQLEAIAMQNQMIKEAVNAEVIFTADEIQQRRYDLIEKGERDRRGQMRYAYDTGIAEGEKRGEKRGISIGEKRGISIGEKRGISIGEKRGEDRAKKQYRQQEEERVSRLLKKGVDLDLIMDFTTLSAADVLRLKETLQQG